jgi:hypothetical protein
MRQLAAVLGVVAVLAGVAVTSAAAAPSDVRAAVGGQATLVSPTTLLLPVTYVCPESFGLAFVSGNVSQADTGAQGFGFVSAPCTGEARTVVLTVTAFGPPWALEPALARVFVSAGPQFDERTRRIQIVL